MDIVLCVYFTKTNIHTFIIQRSKASSDFEASCKRCMPLSSLCIGDHEEKKYVFGLSTLGFSELIPNSIILSDPTDFMRIPIIPNQSIQAGEKIPLYYLLQDIKEKYSKWCPGPISHLLFACSVDIYISYSIIISDVGLQCGFSNVKVKDDSSLLVQSLLHSERFPLPKGNFISIQSNDDSFFISLVSLSSYLESTFTYEEVPNMSCAFLQKELSLDASSIHQLQYCSEFGTISSSILSSYYERLKQPFLTRIETLLHQRTWSLASVSGIVLHGSWIPLPLMSFISSLFPTLQVFTFFSLRDGLWCDACLLFCNQFFGKKGEKEVMYIGEEVDGVKEGYGEEFHFGVCTYRGFWKNNMYHGFGELMSQERDCVYRGEFQNNVYEGVGILYLHENEMLKGEFHDGCIVDGYHCSYYPNNKVCYEGTYKRGMRNGIGKEFDLEGRCVYEGCFLDDQRYGNGILYIATGSLEGSFVDGVFDGEVREYSNNHVLRSVTTYAHGVQCNQGTFYTEDGYLLYEGGVLNNLYYSHGILYYPGGHIQYDGEFLDGLFSGYGQLYNEQGDLVYIGEFKKGLRDGHGKEYGSNMFLKYVGMYQNDKRHGHGKVFFSEGHYYEGNFTEGEVTGKGKMVWSDGRYYDGELVQGRKEGTGVYTWSDHQRYEGEWKQDRREGKGTQYDTDGLVIYSGDWKMDSPNGEGTIHYSNGSYYVGQVVKNKREGKGKQYNEDDVMEFEGEWEDDRPNGYGTFYYDDKCSYEGQWVHGEREGTGRLVYSNGTSFLGHFKNGYRHGKGCWLNAQGKIIREEVYEMGNGENE